jgi:hypothetical protein
MAGDGLIGLMPTKQSDDPLDLLVDKLFKIGKINKKIFSIFIGYNSTKFIEYSKIWIGVDITPSGASIDWVPLSDNYYWSVTFGNLSVGG